VWTYSANDQMYELLWVHADGTYIGALYHPPRPQYTTESPLDYINGCVEELSSRDPATTIVLTGDSTRSPINR